MRMSPAFFVTKNKEAHAFFQSVRNELAAEPKSLCPGFDNLTEEEKADTVKDLKNTM